MFARLFTFGLPTSLQPEMIDEIKSHRCREGVHIANDSHGLPYSPLARFPHLCQ